MIARVGVAALSHPPKSLPLPLQDQYSQALTAHIDDVAKNGLKWKKDPDTGTFYTTPSGGALCDDIMFVSLRVKSGEGVEDLRMVPLQQCVITQFAHLDAYLYDVFVLACLAEPRRFLQCTKKNITYSEVFRASEDGDIVRGLAEHEAALIGHKDLAGKLAEISAALDVDIKIEPNTMRELRRAEQSRHAFVHTGGFVSPLIAARLRDKDFAVGDKISVDLNYCEHLTEALYAVGAAVHIALGKRFWPEQVLSRPRGGLRDVR